MVRADYSKTSSLSIPTESASSGLESLEYAFRLSCSGRCSSAAEQGSHKPRVGGSIPPTATNTRRGGAHDRHSGAARRADRDGRLQPAGDAQRDQSGDVDGDRPRDGGAGEG